ncbi:MAG: phosphoribosylanthranilate isomerase [Chloroflexi bacterium]|nr:phosphoribosylanthranilate isomerase [Chloroflexota bacterium]
MKQEDTHVHVKICGLTREEDALAAAEAGADLLGMVLYPQNPRYVTPERAAAMVQAVRDAGYTRVRLVAVTLNAPRYLLDLLLRDVGVDLVQLHGDEAPVILSDYAGRAYKALRPTSEEELDLDAPWFLDSAPKEGPRLLLDAGGLDHGDVGHLAAWKVARRLIRRYPVLVSGGLTPDNVADVIRALRPWGVDVTDGVEQGPGRKDWAKMRAFVQRVREAAGE